MFYEEQIINGVLHWRDRPDGQWTAYTAEQLTEKHRGATFQRDELLKAIRSTLDYFNGREAATLDIYSVPNQTEDIIGWHDLAALREYLQKMKAAPPAPEESK